MVAVAICMVTMQFIWHRCVPNRGHNIPTKFADNRSNDKHIGILLRNSRWRRLSCWILVIWPFRLACMYSVANSQYPYQIKHLISQIVKKWQPFFLNLRWRRPPSWIFETMYFRRHRNDLNRSLNVFIKFGEDRSNSKEMAAVFRNPRWRRPPSWIVVR